MSAEDFVPQTFTVSLEPDLSGAVLGPISDATFVGTHTLHGCVITTTVRDVRHGKYTSGIDGEVKEACVILLTFGFGTSADKRIRNLSITLSFSLDDNIPHSTTSTASVGGVRNDLELRLFEPCSGQGRSSSKKVKSETIASAGTTSSFPAAVPINLGGGFRKTVESEKTTSATVEAVQEKSNVVRWSLYEDPSAKQGIPSSLNCAVVLRVPQQQTFTSSVKFAARISSVMWRYTGSKMSFLDSSHLQNRRSTLPQHQMTMFEDMSSEEFRDWIQQEVKNDWIVGAGG